jgi:prepilin-type N-terminal cleavage/methylation domain-containing protein
MKLLPNIIQSGRKLIRRARPRGGFTLMEVMIAIGVFCVGVFAILSLVATVMRGARLLDRPMVDAGVVAGQIAQTNSIIETSASGDLSEFLGERYKGFKYVYTINELETNKLFEADIAVTSDAQGKPVISKMSVLLYRPQSPAGSMDGATVVR